MSIQVFHGEGIAASRKLLLAAVDKDKSEGREIQYVEGEKLAPKDLESTLATANLFAQSTLVIEHLLGRLRSKDKDACIELLAKYEGDKSILLWEKKAITKIGLGKLKNAKVSESKAPTKLFTFVESLVPGNTKEALKLMHEVARETEDIVILTMIARQISYLIMIKSASAPKFAPWQMGKLRSQASAWSDAQLLTWMQELLKIDKAIKTGATKQTYLDHLDILLISLLG